MALSWLNRKKLQNGKVRSEEGASISFKVEKGSLFGRYQTARFCQPFEKPTEKRWPYWLHHQSHIEGAKVGIINECEILYFVKMILFCWFSHCLY
jgi:hypothetical protein